MPSRMRETAVVRALVSVTAFLSSGALHAATPETAPQVEGAADADSAHTSEGDIVVNGHQFRGVTTPLRLSVDPRSDTASVTALSGDDIGRQTLGTNIDVFRSIPGVQVGDFGQVGIAQGVSLRGWAGANDSNAVAFYQDGVQRNEGSSTGANGYLDINPLIPEVIDQLTVVKGPFDTRYGGPFALAGSAILTTRDTIDNRISLSAGSYGQVRSVLTLGGSSGETTYYTAIQGLRDDGYQRNSDQKQISSFSKITTPLGAGKLSFSVQTFNIKFGSPGYLDLADIKAGIISPRSDVSDTDGGKKNEYTGILSYKAGDDRQGVEATAFAIHEYRTRFGTFTPFPQSFTRNKRTDFGASVGSHWTTNLLGVETQVQAGASARYDDIEIGRVPSIDGVRIVTPDPLDIYGYQRSDIGFTQLAGYASVGIKPADWFKATAGLRYDWFDFDITDQAYAPATNSFVDSRVKSSTGRFSFKGGVSAQPLPELTLFANFGQSLAPPDAGRDLVGNPGLESAKLETKEVGAALNLLHGRLSIKGNYYTTTFSNEVIFVGQFPVNQGRTKRKGWDVETSAIAYKSSDLTARLYANYSDVDARDQGGNFVPNVARWVASYGAHVDWLTGTDGNLIRFDIGQQWTGPQSLNNPEEVRTKSSSRISSKLSYDIPSFHDLKLWTSAILYPGSRFDEFGFTLFGRQYVSSLPRFRAQLGASIGF